MIQIAKTLVTARKARGWTQEQVAQFCNVTKASVSKWEKGVSYPDITMLPQLAALFEMTIDELLNAKRTLNRNEIRTRYHQFAARFANEPFDVVYAGVVQEGKLYYDDEHYLLQLTILLMNHMALCQTPAAMQQQMIDWLKRIEHITSDVWVLRQVNALLALHALLQGQPQDVLTRLQGSERPHLGEELTLAQGYELLGEQKAAARTIQVMTYQALLQLIGGAVHYVRLMKDNEGAFTTTVQRIDALIATYDIANWHPNSCLQFYYAVAVSAALRGDGAMSERYLTQYVHVATHALFPIVLKGDAYFDLVDDWLEGSLDLGTQALRNDEMVKQSLIQSLQAPYFASFDWLPALQQRLEEGL